MNRQINKSLKYYYSQIVVKACLLSISISYFYIGVNRLYIGTPDLPQYIDNAMRFYAGGFIAIGLLAAWAMVVSKIHNIIIFFFALIVFMTGLGRLTSIIAVGLPNNAYLFYLLIELFLPLLMLAAQIKLEN